MEIELLNCKNCKEQKTTEHFSKNSATSTGFSNTCKDCHKSNYAKDIEKIKKRQAAWRSKNRESLRERARKHHFENKDREKLRRKKYARTLIGKYTALKGMAKFRKKELYITFEEYSKIVEDNKCFYCDNNLPEAGHGLDRINNNLGYTVDNVVPSCKECNQIRMNNITHTEMIEVAKLLKSLRMLNNTK